jgi:hypothetical protein
MNHVLGPSGLDVIYTDSGRLEHTAKPGKEQSLQRALCEGQGRRG